MLPLLAACSDDEQETPTLSTEPIVELPEDVKITIGVISDMTGPGANAYIDIDMALADIVEYYNEENLIPGVELEVITYDGQFDPSRDIPGYKWLKEGGADLIFSSIEGTPIVLKPFVDKDKIVMFTGSALREALEPPGYMFAPAHTQDESFYTFLKWIAENDWDYETNGPARIGLTNWSIPLDITIADAIEEYCEEHPEQFKWVGSYFTNFSFTWETEVQELKDCDYVVPPTVLMAKFAEEYRASGCTAKFLGYDAHLAYLGKVVASNGWDNVNGALFYRAAKYWNEEGPLINLTKQLLYTYHPDEAEEIVLNGIGYTSVVTFYQILEIITDAVEAVGPSKFDSQSLYEAAQRYSLSLDGIDDFATFGPGKRTSSNYIAIYELDAAQEDVFRVEPGVWHPIIRRH